MNNSQIINNFNQALKINRVDPSLQEIHDQFINFVSGFINIKPLTKDEIKLNQNMLGEILNETDFMNFCENTSNGIYYKCCFWAKNNLKPEALTGVNSFVFEKHHIECQYMKKRSDISQNHYNLISQKYNLVTLSYHMHILMHTIRYIEYCYREDLTFLTFIKPDLKTIEESTQEKDDLSKATIADFLLEQLVSNPNYYFDDVSQTIRELKAEAGKKGGIKNALKITNPVINNYLQNEMNWINCKSKVELKFKAKEFKVLRELVVELNKKTPQNELPKDWSTNNKALSSCCTEMKKYLLATPIIDKRKGNDNNIKYYYSPTYKKQWSLAETESNEYRLENIQKIQEKPKPPNASKQPQQVKDLLSQNDTIWSNQKYETQNIFVYAGEFVNLSDLAYKLLLFLPIEKRPKKFELFNTDSKTKSIIVYELSSLICKKKPEKIKTYYGWTFQILDDCALPDS